MQVKLVWRHFGLKFVFKYDRNTVINILKKQGVPAPWVIILLLYRSSHILRTRESYINSELHSIIVTNISRSSPHTTSWFIEVRHINISRLTLKICSLICASRLSENQISNFKSSAFFSVLFALWLLK